MNFTCAECKVLSCRKPEHADMPLNCPMRLQPELMAEVRERYEEPLIKESMKQGAYLEAEGFGRYPRLKETIMYCQRMGFKHIGVAFCSGLDTEACIVTKLLREAGFEVDSVRCKCGGIPKTDLGISEEHFVHPVQGYESACNPIGQAALLAECKTEFNIVIGLCVGHDALFLQNSKALTTVLIAKDRACGHNPVAALYCHQRGYWGEMMDKPGSKE